MIQELEQGKKDVWVLGKGRGKDRVPSPRVLKAEAAAAITTHPRHRKVECRFPQSFRRQFQRRWLACRSLCRMQASISTRRSGEIFRSLLTAIRDPNRLHLQMVQATVAASAQTKARALAKERAPVSDLAVKATWAAARTIP